MNLSVLISRIDLGLSSLELNDGVNFQVSDPFDGGSTSWRRQQVESPFVDGKVLVGLVKDTVEARVGIEIYGSSSSDARTKVSTLVDAFTQFSYTLTITIDGAQYIWTCDAADYALNWAEKARLHANRYQMVFAFQRDPNAVSGPL